MALDYISREKKLPAITPENYCVKIKVIAVVDVFLFLDREREGSKIHTWFSARTCFFAR
jgi:hypothetical protein